MRGEKVIGDVCDPLYRLTKLRLEEQDIDICQLATGSKKDSLDEDDYEAIRNHLKIVFNQLPKTLQG